MTNKQRGYINIPVWVFFMIPVGVVLTIVEVVRILMWLYENIEVTLK